MNTGANELNKDSELSQEWLDWLDKKHERGSLKQFISNVLQRIVEMFTPSSELRIFAGRDQHGNTYYRVYDVLTHEFYHFESENDVRIWLEGRYY